MYWYLVVFIKTVLQNFKNFVVLRLHYKGKRDAQKNVSHIDKKYASWDNKNYDFHKYNAMKSKSLNVIRYH